MSEFTNGVVAVAFLADHWVAATNTVTGDLEGESKRVELFRVDDQEIVFRLLAEICQINKHRDTANWSFSGTLPWIVFLRRDGSVAGDAMVTLDDSSIGVGKLFHADVTGIQIGTNYQTYAEGINRDFGRLVCSLLWEHIPDWVVMHDQWLRKEGETNGLYQVLGLRMSDVPAKLIQQRNVEVQRAEKVRIDSLLRLSTKLSVGTTTKSTLSSESAPSAPPD